MDDNINNEIDNETEDVENVVKSERNWEKLSQKMVNSDYRPNYIKRVMQAGWMSYTARLKNSQLPKNHPAYKPLHLGTKFDSYGRWKKNVMARENWYNDSQDQ